MFPFFVFPRHEIRCLSSPRSAFCGIYQGILWARHFCYVGRCHAEFLVLDRGQLPSPRGPPRHHWTKLEGRYPPVCVRSRSRTSRQSRSPAVPQSRPPATQKSSLPAAVLSSPKPIATVSLTTNQKKNLRRKRLSAPAPESAPACLSEILDMALLPEFSAPILSPESAPKSSPSAPSSPLIPASSAPPSALQCPLFLSALQTPSRHLRPDFPQYFFFFGGGGGGAYIHCLSGRAESQGQGDCYAIVS